MSLQESVRQAPTIEDLLYKCREDGRELGRKFMGLLQAGEPTRQMVHFLTNEAECHRVQHEGFLSELALDPLLDPEHPNRIVHIGSLCLVRERAFGVQIEPDGALTEVPFGWNYRIEPIDTPTASASA